MRKAMLVLTGALILQLLVVTAGLAAPPAFDPIYHVVRRGETLSYIGRLYGVSPWAIARANSIPNPDLIYVGQVLYISAGQPSHERCVHVVRPGENLTMIAWRYGTTVWAIARANSISNPNLIYIGQRLVIPGWVAPKPTPKPKVTIEAIVKWVSPSARLIRLQEPVDGFSTIALTLGTELISGDGKPLTLHKLQPGMKVQASGQPGESDALLADRVVVLEPEATRIQFEPGATSATVTGYLGQYDSAPYVLRAFAGQRMEVEITSPNKVVLSIWADDWTVLKSYAVGGACWVGSLPSTQDYFISVSSVGKETSYELFVAIPP